MSKKFGLNPWLSIWFQPRKTIRSIINFDPRFRFPLLSGIYGFPLLLHFAQNLSLGQNISSLSIVVVALILSVFAGMLGICVISYLLFWTGKWIGGTGSFIHIRAAVTWSNVPNVVNGITWLILLGIFQGQIFYGNFSQMGFTGYELSAVFFLFLIQAVMGVWGLITLLHTLGEVQGFSAWKALLNVAIPFVLITAALWIILWLAMGNRAVGV